MKVRDESYSFPDVSGSIRREGQGESSWLQGTVKTPHGIVEVYSQGHDGGRALTSASFICDGRIYRRTWQDRYFSRRGLAIIAGKFAREIAERV